MYGIKGVYEETRLGTQAKVAEGVLVYGAAQVYGGIGGLYIRVSKKSGALVFLGSCSRDTRKKDPLNLLGTRDRDGPKASIPWNPRQAGQRERPNA